ncbi:MAG: MerR family transcriptional regulator [Acidimicrobiia bacterium]|nr:MerR family transcriptional regulator [Acidimicrobiia bacterium]
MEPDKRALYVISVAAELAGAHPQTLRIYERRGLIEPQRTAGRSRRYSDADIDRLRRIQELTQAGVGLAGVQRILELEAELGRARAALARAEAALESTRREADAAVADAHRRYRRDLVPLPPRAVVRYRGRFLGREQT